MKNVQDLQEYSRTLLVVIEQSLKEGVNMFMNGKTHCLDNIFPQITHKIKAIIILKCPCF